MMERIFLSSEFQREIHARRYFQLWRKHKQYSRGSNAVAITQFFFSSFLFPFFFPPPSKAPLQIYNSCDNAKGSNTGVQFVLVAVAASATSQRDQRRKSGLYFRGRGGGKKSMICKRVTEHRLYPTRNRCSSRVP